MERDATQHDSILVRVNISSKLEDGLAKIAETKDQYPCPYQELRTD